MFGCYQHDGQNFKKSVNKKLIIHSTRGTLSHGSGARNTSMTQICLEMNVSDQTLALLSLSCHSSVIILPLFCHHLSLSSNSHLTFSWFSSSSSNNVKDNSNYSHHLSLFCHSPLTNLSLFCHSPLTHISFSCNTLVTFLSPTFFSPVTPILFHRASIKALYKRGYTFSRSWMVENFDGGMCNPFLAI